MAWIQPKTDWVASDYFNAKDYNRIKNNIAYLKNFTDSLFVSLKWITGKNLLKNTAKSQKVGNVNFTVNADGSVTVNTDGAATGDATIRLNKNVSAGGTLDLEHGKYILSGCPSGGSPTTYKMQFWNEDGTSAVKFEFGDGLEIDFSNKSGNYDVVIAIKAGTVANNLTFYPMIRKADITDATYEPHYDVIPDATADLITIGSDKGVLSLLYAREINNIETNLETINAKTYQLDIGSKVTYSANKPTPLYEEYNRIEKAILRLYEMLQVHKANLPRLALTLGQKGF